MDRLINDKNFSLQLLGFVILQPFVDIYRVFFENTIEIAGISLAELINLLAIAYLIFLFVVKYIKQPKYFLAGCDIRSTSGRILHPAYLE